MNTSSFKSVSKKIRHSFALISVSALLLAYSGPAFSADNGEMSIYPKLQDDEEEQAWFVYNLSPGQSVSDEATISNASSDPIDVKIYAADAVMTRDGGFALRNYDEEKKDIAAWVTLPFETAHIEPNQQIDVPFTIAIPEHADVGEHLGGILIENIQPTQDNSNESINLNVITRVGVRIYETVPGEIVQKIEVSNLNLNIVNSKLNLSLSLSNQGNIQIEPSASFDLTDTFGKRIEIKDELLLGTILRDGTLEYKLQFDKKLLPGRYTIDGIINYGDDQSIELSKSMYYLPIWLLPLGALAIGLLVLVVVVSKKINRFIKHSRELEKMLAAEQEKKNNQEKKETERNTEDKSTKTTKKKKKTLQE